MSDSQYSKHDLEERTFHFAQEIRKCLKTVKVHPLQYDDAKQLIRSSGSVAANYIEANESLSKKDFIMRIKNSRKEAKETILWLKLLDLPDLYIKESTELMKILVLYLKSQSELLRICKIRIYGLFSI